MNTSIWLVAGLLMLSGPSAFAQDYRLPAPAQSAPGSPGTSTPQPFTQPTLRNVPQGTPSSAPLINRGTGGNSSRLNPSRGTLAPPDADLPLLEEQRQRNSQGLGGDSRKAD